MFLIIRLQTPEGEIKEVVYSNSKFEDNIRLLNKLASTNQIQAATLVEDQQRWSLPVKAFDGQPEDATILAQLQEQWEKILYNR